MRHAIVLTLSLLPLVGIVACAGDPSQASSSSSTYTEREYRTGSNIPTREKRRPMTDEERQEQQRQIDDMRAAAARQAGSQTPGRTGP